MSFARGFRGNVGGAVQTAYTDQPGLAVAGMIAFASDNYLADAILINETDGIAAGLGVAVAAGAADAWNLQLPNIVASLPVDDEPVTDFGGILMFDEAMQSDENGVPGWADGRVGRVLRHVRAGGRIWVKAQTVVSLGDPVEWVVKPGTAPALVRGGFSGIAYDGTTTLPLTRNLANAKWITAAAAAGDLAMIEFI